MSHSDWLKQVESRRKTWREWLEARSNGKSAEAAWKIIQEDTGLKRSKGVSCTNLLTNVIPTLPLTPFYDRVYMLVQHRVPLSGAVASERDFKRANGLSSEDVGALAGEGAVVPVPDIFEDMTSDFMQEFWAKLEKRGVPFLPKAYAYMLANDFQIKNNILLPDRWDSPEFAARGYISILADVAGFESVWVTERPIPQLDASSMSLIRQAMLAMGNLAALQENTAIISLLEGLDLAYSPRMSLKGYLRVFSPERKKRLRELVERATKGQIDVQNVAQESSQAIAELREICRSKKWKVFSRLGSLVKANPLTLIGASVGLATGGLPIALIAGVLGKLSEVRVPEELRRDFGRLDQLGEQATTQLSAMVLRKSPGLLHLLKMQTELSALRAG